MTTPVDHAMALEKVLLMLGHFACGCPGFCSEKYGDKEGCASWRAHRALKEYESIAAHREEPAPPATGGDSLRQEIDEILVLFGYTLDIDNVDWMRERLHDFARSVQAAQREADQVLCGKILGAFTGNYFAELIRLGHSPFAFRQSGPNEGKGT
jgi:hypothetical protein